MTASASSRNPRTSRQSKSFAVTLAAAAGMFLVASLLFSFVLFDSYASFNNAWTLVFFIVISILVLAAAGTGWHARRIWRDARN